MTTASKNLTFGTSLIGIQKVTASTVVVGSEVNVAGNGSSGGLSPGSLSGTIYIHFGRVTTTAPTAGVNFRIESCALATGTLAANKASQWYPVYTYTTGIVVAATTTVSASSTNVLTVASGTSFTAGNIAVVSSVTTGYSDSNTEWFRCVSETSTTVTAEESFLNSYSTGNLYTQAEIQAIPIDLTSIGRLRVVVDSSLHNQAFLTEVWLTTCDSFNNA